MGRLHAYDQAAMALAKERSVKSSFTNPLATLRASLTGIALAKENVKKQRINFSLESPFYWGFADILA